MPQEAGCAHGRAGVRAAIGKDLEQVEEEGDRFFPYRWDRRFVPVLSVLGARPHRDGVILTSGHLIASLGPVRLTTPLHNVRDAHVTGPYRWWTALGPRRSFADDGLTFGTNAQAGVCLHFGEPVPSPLRRRGHSALTVTVDDLDGLTQEVRRRGVGVRGQKEPIDAPQLPTER